MKIFTTNKNKFYSPSSKRWLEDTELRFFGFKIWTERNFVQHPSESVEMLEYRAMVSLRKERRNIDFSELPALPNNEFDQFQNDIFPTRF